MKKHLGFTLTEMMIALAIGLIVLLAVSTLFVNFTTSASHERQQAALRAMMDSAMSSMAMSLRRAGYAGEADPVPYARIFIGQNGHCLRFAYASPPGESAQDPHFYALRLKQQDGKGRIQQLATRQDNWHCGAPDADWQDLTLPAAGSVTGLSFSQTGRDGIHIALSAQQGELAALALAATVTPRNHPIITQEATR